MVRQRLNVERMRLLGAEVVGVFDVFEETAQRVGADTLLAQIVQMVAAAQRSRAPIQKLADAVAGKFVPAVIAVAVIAFVAWAVWGPAPSYAYALVSAIAVLASLAEEGGSRSR